MKEVEILTNPIRNVFMSLVKGTKEQMFLSSPFIKKNITKDIFENKNSGIQVSVLTAYKLTNFYRNSSDVEALKHLLENQAEVKSYSRLHAKTYIFDCEKAIVTSGNLTLGGLETNYECGVLVHEQSLIKELRSNFLKVFEDTEKVSLVTEEIISVTEEIISKVPKEKRIKFEKSEKDLFAEAACEPEDDLYDGGIETVANTLSGWRLDVFKTVSNISENVFKLENVYIYKDELQKLHPDNRNIEAKIRQQLQELRDLGLIEFLMPGVYRKLWKNV